MLNEKIVFKIILVFGLIIAIFGFWNYWEANNVYSSSAEVAATIDSTTFFELPSNVRTTLMDNYYRAESSKLSSTNAMINFISGLTIVLLAMQLIGGRRK